MATPTSNKAPIRPGTGTRPHEPLSRRARWVVLTLAGFTVAATGLATWMAQQDLDPDSLWFEIGTLVAQAGILTGFGALVGLLVHEFQQDQEDSRQRVEAHTQRMSSRREWLRDFAVRTTDAYTELKLARRRLQWSRCTADGRTALPFEVFEEQMQQISAVQARFEVLVTMARTFGRGHDLLVRPLRAIADNLSHLVAERKQHLPAIADEAPVTVALDHRPLLRGFIADSEESGFREPSGFGPIRDHYKSVLHWIVHELDDPTEPPSGSLSHGPPARR